jgi:hypothetical protein
MVDNIAKYDKQKPIKTNPYPTSCGFLEKLYNPLVFNVFDSAPIARLYPSGTIANRTITNPIIMAIVDKVNNTVLSANGGNSGHLTGR